MRYSPVAGFLFMLAIFVCGCGEKIPSDRTIGPSDLAHAEKLVDLEMTDSERELMLDDLQEQRQGYQKMRSLEIANAVRPALRFDPELLTGPPDDLTDRPSRWSDPGQVQRPDDLNELAFYSVAELGVLIRTRQVSSLELTQLSLDRLIKHGPQLKCVINLVVDRALKRARLMDQLLDQGINLGPLHGIPYGAKDLLAVADAPTTWGAAPYQDQILRETATIITKLDNAGAVLVAKLTLGALAWGDVWFDGKTRNPWNPDQGSSGSSAGSASAVAAGLVPFALGTETLGSIVSPCTRCGTTGLRPTFGRVSKAGAMALSWSMDKIGPIARSTEDCALVFDVIRGADAADPTSVDRPFTYDPEIDLSRLRIGYLATDFDQEYPAHDLDQTALQNLRDLGAELIPIELPLEENNLDPGAIAVVLSVEAAAAFQELTLSGRDDLLVRQVRYAWPNTFRAAHFVPAVEYVQANRARLELMAMMGKIFEEIDLYVTPSLMGNSLVVTNLTGHPQVVLPAGFVHDDAPHSISFVGDLYDEATILAVARAYEQAAGWHKKHPPRF